MTAASESTQKQWLAQASRSARRINLAWWLDVLSLPLLTMALVCSAGLLLVRREFPTLPPGILFSVIAGICCLVWLVCWLVARRKFETPEQAMVRIEAALPLNNSLSAARAGVTAWPEFPAKFPQDLRWQWPRLLVPALGSLLLLAAGIFIPISPSKTAAAAPEQPQSWTNLSAELDHLAEEKVVDETYLEETRKKLDELKSQNEEQWFSHSSLEATDTLKNSHQAETQRVEEELEKALKSLNQLEKSGATTGDAQKKQLLDDFDRSLQGLQNGAMKPNPELLKQMKQLNQQGTGQLSPEQKQQLAENLKKHADAMKKGQGEGSTGDDWSDELLSGEGDGKKEGPEGKGPGKGGINRGPGHDPNVLGQATGEVPIGANTALEAKDLSHATPGDLLELQDGEHEANLSESRITSGGNTTATGQGGDRVWKESLDPDEQNAVKRFFK